MPHRAPCVEMLVEQAGPQSSLVQTIIRHGDITARAILGEFYQNLVAIFHPCFY